MKNTALSSTVEQFDTSISQQINEELIAWSVKLSSGAINDEERAAFLKWRTSSSLNESAWLKLQSIDSSFAEFDSHVAPFVSKTIRKVAQKKILNRERRKKIKLLGLIAIAAIGSSILVSNYVPGLSEQSYVAAVGKRETVLLSDGTKLMLNTNTKVDVKYSFFKREIVMLQGEIYIETGSDSESLIGKRSFWVKTKQADLEAVGTRFAVKQGITSTRLHVSEGIVAVHTGGSLVNAYANDTYVISDSEQSPSKINSAIDPVGWVDNVLVAKQMRLEDFAAELSNYRQQPIYCDTGSKNLQVSGVFQLGTEDPADHILKGLVRILPVTVSPQKDHSILIVHK